MALTVKICWDKPIDLGAKGTCREELRSVLPKMTVEAGIYIFARKHGKKLFPIYIGQAMNLRTRLKQQSNAMDLMHAISGGKTGNRILLIGNIKSGSKALLARFLDIAEQSHIEHALQFGYEIVNVHGTRRKSHTITIVGPKKHLHPFPSELYLAE